MVTGFAGEGQEVAGAKVGAVGEIDGDGEARDERAREDAEGLSGEGVQDVVGDVCHAEAGIVDAPGAIPLAFEAHVVGTALCWRIAAAGEVNIDAQCADDAKGIDGLSGLVVELLGDYDGHGVAVGEELLQGVFEVFGVVVSDGVEYWSIGASGGLPLKTQEFV